MKTNIFISNALVSMSSLLAGCGILSLLACDPLQNKIDERTLSCGMTSDLQSLRWVRIQDEDANDLDLNHLAFSVVKADFEAVSNESYRVSSKGCLGLPRQQEFIVRIPGKKLSFTKLEASDDSFELLALQTSETSLKVRLEPAQAVYRGGALVSVRTTEKSKSRFCLEKESEQRCIKGSDLNATVSSPDFLLIRAPIELPASEGRYRLHILSEVRDGSLNIFPYEFAIDNTAPAVIPDFADRLSAISYFGQATYFLEEGYPIKFLSLDDNLASTRIEYCLLPLESRMSVCSSPEIYGIQNPLLVPQGASKLLYRAFDSAGNVSPGDWRSLTLMSRVSCEAVTFVQALREAHPLNCHILEGDLLVHELDPKDFSALDRLIEVTGRIQYASETSTKVPKFANLKSAFAIDFNLGAELENDFNAFPQIRQLKELSLRLSMGGKSIDAFNDLTQATRINLGALDNVKDLKIFHSLKTVDDYLWLFALRTVTNLDFLSALNQVGELRIISNDELLNIEGLSNLQSVARLEIGSNPKLASLKGLGSVIWLEKLDLSNLPIPNFEGLENLREVTESLFVRSNQQLESLKGLENLSRVSYFLFRDNDRLPAGTQLLGQTIEQ